MENSIYENDHKLALLVLQEANNIEKNQLGAEL